MLEIPIMLYERFYAIMTSRPLSNFFENKAAIVKKTDPNRIYVENVRAFFGLTYGLASSLCEAAVREGIFEKRVGYLCPHDQRMIRSFAPDEKVPETLSCGICEVEENYPYEFRTADLETISFYRLVRRHDAS